MKGLLEELELKVGDFVTWEIGLTDENLGVIIDEATLMVMNDKKDTLSWRQTYKFGDRVALEVFGAVKKFDT